jgi:hypothetical protein
MTKIDNIKVSPDQFNSIMCLKAKIIKGLWYYLEPIFKNYYRHYDMKGYYCKMPSYQERSNSNLAGSVNKLLLTKLYEREPNSDIS